MRKFLALALSVLMVFSLAAVFASAAGEPAVALQIPTGKVNVLAGLTASFKSENKTGTTSLITDGRLAVYTKGHYTNYKASTSENDETNAIEVQVGAETVKYFYTYTFELNAPSTVDSFTVAYCSDSGACSENNIDSKVSLLVSTDSGATYQVVYENTSDVFGLTECVLTSTAIGDTVLNYYKGEITLSQSYTGVTNIIWAARKHRNGTSNNKYAARMSEFAVFGPDPAQTNPGTTEPITSGSEDPNPSTGDNFAIVMVIGAAVLVTGAVIVFKKREED